MSYHHLYNVKRIKILGSRVDKHFEYWISGCLILACKNYTNFYLAIKYRTDSRNTLILWTR